MKTEETCTLVGLIRGINVGRAKRVAMADLRALVAGLGYTAVGDALGDTVTMRNWATVLKLRDLSGIGG